MSTQSPEKHLCSWAAPKAAWPAGQGRCLHSAALLTPSWGRAAPSSGAQQGHIAGEAPEEGQEGPRAVTAWSNQGVPAHSKGVGTRS